MLVVETIAKMRRKCLVEGRSIRSVARDLGLARNAVRKVVRGGATEHRHDRGEAQPYPKLDGFIGELEGLLKTNKDLSKRDKQTLKSIWKTLCDQGCRAGCDAVRRHVQRWEARQGGRLSKACVPLAFDPGEAFRLDWSRERVRLAGMPQVAKVAQFTLCCSRMPFICCHPRETQEMVFDAHDRAFAAFGGQAERGIHDNMTTAAGKVLVGRDRTINPRFAQMRSRFPTDPSFRAPEAGWEKGRVERRTGTLRRNFFLPFPECETLECLNGQLAERALRHARTHPHPEFPEMSILEVFLREEQRCLASPVPPFRGYAPIAAKASRTCMIRFDMNWHSVEARASGRPVEGRAYADRVEVRLDGQVVADHERHFGRNRHICDVRHFIPILERKPGALRNGAPFRAEHLPPAVAEAKARLDSREDGGKQMARIPLEARDRGLEPVAAACAEALEAGACSADPVLNILSRRRDPGPAAVVATPAGLELRTEPVADCARCDDLPGRCE